MYYGERQGWKLAVAILLCLPLLFVCSVRLYKHIVFQINISGHLKRAADANTIELAKGELAVVVAYLNQEGMTSGYTSIVYRTPDEDVGFWYNNIKASFEELVIVRPDAAQLEKSNILMKLRETLIDNGREGTEVTLPDGIDIFPHNAAYCIAFILSALGSIIGIILFVNYLDP